MPPGLPTAAATRLGRLPATKLPTLFAVPLSREMLLLEMRLLRWCDKHSLQLRSLTPSPLSLPSPCAATEAAAGEVPPLQGLEQTFAGGIDNRDDQGGLGRRVCSSMCPGSGQLFAAWAAALSAGAAPLSADGHQRRASCACWRLLPHLVHSPTPAALLPLWLASTLLHCRGGAAPRQPAHFQRCR